MADNSYGLICVAGLVFVAIGSIDLLELLIAWYSNANALFMGIIKPTIYGGLLFLRIKNAGANGTAAAAGKVQGDIRMVVLNFLLSLLSFSLGMAALSFDIMLVANEAIGCFYACVVFTVLNTICITSEWIWAFDQATRRNKTLGKRREQARAPLLPGAQLDNAVAVAPMDGVYEEYSRPITV